ncbi:hypothetical protein [Thiocystis violacea]|uniref:hypothetical protein n=1 Tax=Thiocystis violacea TaxID=13725 RepID=UPI0019041978|nr:hypothetical protein [Thiocystis violacea]MBK1722961.1 hypothetical protein [Thiocystis violacea]
MAVDSQKASHRWRFNRLGGFDQVMIESGEDIRHLPDLEQKLWAALSCPARGVALDAHTLALLDANGDGRIRVTEVLDAATWTCTLLKDPNDLFRHSEGLPLTAIDDSTEEGKQVLASAWRILENLGKGKEKVITAADTADNTQIFAGTRYNGDGVVPPAASKEPKIVQAIEDIMACVGSVPDRSGADGINQELSDQFFEEAAAYLEWWAEAEADPERILPLGEATTAAAETFERVRAKIDDYFTRTRLADYDIRATDFLNPAEADYTALALKPLSRATEALVDFPLARVEAERPLPLAQGLNPRWTDAMATFRAQVVAPLLGDVEALSEAEWLDISERFAAHETWRGAQRGCLVAPLGLARVKELTTGKAKAAVDALIAQDKEHEAAANAIASVDRLVHYYQHLEPLLQNFVSLRDFYTPGKKAIFQAGTLYLDGRSCDLCVRVDDVAAHSLLATLSQIYLAYCTCRRRGGEETMTIAAAVTDGDSDNLMVGRNGVFYDRDGADWDATIVKIIEHPISVREAFWLPYKRIGRMISQQIEKFAAARDKSVDDTAAAGVADASASAEAGAQAASSFDIAKFAGIFAAIGLAVGAIGTALAAVLTGFLGLVWWQMPLAILGIVLAISGPSMLIAFMKLRQRNLGPLLDANGWAVNTRARINIPFGATLTSMAELPKGAVRSLRDPFAEKKRPWKTLIVLIALVAGLVYGWRGGYLDPWLAKLGPMLGVELPAAQTAPETLEPEAAAPAEVEGGEAPPADASAGAATEPGKAE